MLNVWWAVMSRSAGLCVAPALLAVAGVGIAMLLPDQTVWGAAAAALLLSAPVWLMAGWPVWSLLVAWRSGARLVPALCALLGLLLMGRPLPEPVPGAGFKVVAANVNAFTGEPQALETALASVQADAVLIFEKRGAEIDGMVRVADDFDAELTRESHHAAAFCRVGVACQGAVTGQIGSASMAMPIVLVRLGSELCLVGVHAPPPYPKDATGMAPYVHHLSTLISDGRITGNAAPCQPGDAAVVLGDMNAVFVGTAAVSGLHHIVLPGSDHRASVGWYLGH